jgi:hypothetical protein
VVHLAVDALSVAAGVVLLAATSLSVLWTLVVPRATPSRLAEGVVAAVRWAFLGVARLLPDYRRRDRVLAMLPPVALLTLLTAWLALLTVGFALLAAPLTASGTGATITSAATSVLGLEYTDSSAGLRAITLLAVFSGVIVVALLIGYLPTLYDAFSSREELVSLLDSRAGSPAWGVEVLLRATRDDALADLPTLFGEWERWAAAVGESHSSYPILIAFRSQDPARSWVIALLAVLDAAALHVALRPDDDTLAARLCLRTGYMALRSVAATAGIEVDDDPRPEDPIELSRDEFEAGVRTLIAAGYRPQRELEAAWPHFHGWRVNYEHAATALADRIVAPPAPWSGPRTHLPPQTLLPRRPPDRQPCQPDQAGEPSDPAGQR